MALLHQVGVLFRLPIFDACVVRRQLTSVTITDQYQSLSAIITARKRDQAFPGTTGILRRELEHFQGPWYLLTTSHVIVESSDITQ